MSSARLGGILRALCALSLVMTVIVGCGGGGGGDRPARAADDEDGSSAAAPREQAAAEEEESEEPAPRRASCDDGTCSSCGNGICPSGWYCDESAKGSPACAWLPECANKVSCACVTKVFSACSCDEKSGGVHLSCG